MQSMADVEDPSVVIIGCGIAGVAAAHRLTQAGFHHVRILEATGRSGGRIKTHRLSDNVVEMGASYIHGPSEENPLFCVARDYGLLDAEALRPENQAITCDEHPHKASNWFSSSGRRLDAECMNSLADVFCEAVKNTVQFEDDEEAPWDSVGHFVRSEAEKWAAEACKDKDQTSRQLLLGAISTMFKVECCTNGTHSMDEIDLKGFSLYESTNGLDCMIPSGYEDLIKNLMSELPADAVSFNRPVHCIHWNNSEEDGGAQTVTVECEDGDKMAADHVIVTVPLGYLKKHHSTLFSPPLPPHKLLSIHKLGFGTCDKIFVEFESPWWDADCDAIYLVWEDEWDYSEQESDLSRSWVRKIGHFTVVKPSERCGHVLCGWIAGLEAEYMETLPMEEIRRSITELIHSFTGDRSITPKRVVCSRWFSNPWTCGSYSHPAKGCSAQDLENMMEPLPPKGQHQQLQVLFAGEATHHCHYSTVHGALLSGWREAARLVAHRSAAQSASCSHPASEQVKPH